MKLHEFMSFLRPTMSYLMTLVKMRIIFKNGFRNKR
jgi:hypothetical protein